MFALALSVIAGTAIADRYSLTFEGVFTQTWPLTGLPPDAKTPVHVPFTTTLRIDLQPTDSFIAQAAPRPSGNVVHTSFHFLSGSSLSSTDPAVAAAMLGWFGFTLGDLGAPVSSPFAGTRGGMMQRSVTRQPDGSLSSPNSSTALGTSTSFMFGAGAGSGQARLALGIFGGHGDPVSIEAVHTPWTESEVVSFFVGAIDRSLPFTVESDLGVSSLTAFGDRSVRLAGSAQLTQICTAGRFLRRLRG